MSHQKPEPLREVAISNTLRVYVSDAGCLVIEQTDVDPVHVVLEPEQAPKMGAAITALQESLIAKRAAVDLAIEAEHSAWKARGGQ